MQLAYRGEVKRERCRSITDRRRRVIRITAEYAAPDGERYRKTFEALQCNGAPIVPVFGTHEELNAAKLQWTRDGHYAAKDLK